MAKLRLKVYCVCVCVCVCVDGWMDGCVFVFSTPPPTHTIGRGQVHDPGPGQSQANGNGVDDDTESVTELTDSWWSQFKAAQQPKELGLVIVALSTLPNRGVAGLTNASKLMCDFMVATEYAEGAVGKGGQANSCMQSGMRHATAHNNTQQRTATRTPQNAAKHPKTQQRVATCGNTQQHTATHSNMQQHAPIHGSKQ